MVLAPRRGPLFRASVPEPVAVLGSTLLFAVANTPLVLGVMWVLRSTGAPLAPLWTQLLGWPLVWALRSAPVQRLLGGGRTDRLALRMALSCLLFAATLAPTGLLFLFPVAAVLVVTEHIQAQGARAVRPGAVIVVLLTVLLQAGAHLGAWPSVLPDTLGDVSSSMMLGLSVLTMCNMARLSAERESERRARHAELEHAATHDGLTGLLNRAGLHERLRESLRAVGPGGAVAVLFLDLDGFKPVNDRHGHAAGDQLLRLVAHRLGGLLRPGDHLARLGGDEFVVVLTDPAAHGARGGAAAAADSHGEVDAVVAAVVERAEAALRAPFHLQETIVQVSVSIGTAVTRDPTVSADSVLQEADAAMYRAKERLRVPLATGPRNG